MSNGSGPVDGFEQLSRPAKKGPSLKARAVAFLSRREYSRLELQRKLAAYVSDPADLEPLLNELERENWLSNERFVLGLVRRRAPLRGTARVIQELKQHDLSPAHIAAVREQLQQTELERARLVWQKKFGRAPAEAKEYARQFRFLAARGFSPECLRRILGDIDDIKNSPCHF